LLKKVTINNFQTFQKYKFQNNKIPLKKYKF